MGTLLPLNVFFACDGAELPFPLTFPEPYPG